MERTTRACLFPNVVTHKYYFAALLRGALTSHISQDQAMTCTYSGFIEYGVDDARVS